MPYGKKPSASCNSSSTPQSGSGPISTTLLSTTRLNRLFDCRVNKPGTSRKGARCENLEQLTFSDESFDIFISQDVLEHVFSPERALAEIMRVLKTGGIHIFTTPKHKDLLQSRQRARFEQGRVIEIAEPMYHGNPISEKGSLVTWDYGVDFVELAERWSGYQTSVYILHDRRLGIDGEFMDVFMTIKHHTNRISCWK